jgi:hypothetical protein
MSEQDREHELDDDQVEENSLLEMSDEDILNFDPTTLMGNTPVLEEEDTDDGAGEGAPEGGDEPSGEDAKPEGEAEPAAVSEEQEEGEEVPVEKPAEEAAKPEEEKEPTDKSKDSTDYKSEYEKILAPFTANGKQMQVQSAEEAVTLMQMGANYNKKMAALKPNLKLLKLLENNGLLSEEKLSFLIDLDKKNPDAIQKLVKDSGLDPLEMDVSKSEYKPKTYTVDDREVELDSVLEDIQDTPTYNKTIAVVGNKWDGESKRIIVENPQLIKVINDHMASGVFDLISNEIERERVLGRLNGVSDIEAYRTVGDAMHARGALKPASQPTQTSAGKVREPIPAKPAAEKPDTRSKKLAASAPKAAAPVKHDLDFNPLALSDEDFAKIGNPRLM